MDFQASKRVTECLDYLEQEARERPIDVRVVLALVSSCGGHFLICGLCKQLVLHCYQLFACIAVQL